MACRLTKNDSSVLAALFDPESSLTCAVETDDNISTSSSPSRLKLLQEQEVFALKSTNHDQPQPGEIELAISRLTAIIESERLYASAWNNRAQARRMLITDEKLSQNPSCVAEIFKDLAQAILLTTPTKANMAVSIMDARTLASAHTHRGYLLLLASKSEENRKMLANVPGLGQLSIQDLEEAASRELAKGGRYGNERARQLAVKTNSYAKLCGSIVREAITKEISDFYHLQVDLAG
ncbi:hypothetical protein A1O7_05605 [Cladophialophora yegresii CBS 114405]|uniref:Uncharacterized protein n=1 Tax=Cladophialophora yegresii CBS 114405 TaxID=1182544 RepID=W9VZN2_9EURO|nr:uncharacterized protein A1O7_05605 [Cladophialophora yegresii CBS 114405]EXJ58180.1 hypothetical protein A1O7_05605 [Cladophialophora yegresii CBS 114405]